jgi:bifunctional aspartokinase / homoserine dehydrogenase 1
MKVLKFGGSSVANAENIAKVVEIVRRIDYPAVVVLSAMQGTTDRLIDAGRLAEAGDSRYLSKLNELRTQHQLAIDRLFEGSPARDGINGYLEKKLEDLHGICRGVNLIRELSPRTLDRLIAFGELILTRIFSAHLGSIGIENVWVDSRDLIRTDSNYGAASVDFAATNSLVRERFETLKGQLVIAPGFIGCDGRNSITTLGRGGSDYTAAIFGAALDAEVVEIWTDVSGMMTADPRFVSRVRGIERITYREAMELSHFGAKVIYPPTIQPLMAKGIPVRVKNTFQPDEPGTIIEAETRADRNDIVRGITSIDRIAVLNLEGAGMVGVPGFSRRLFDALAREQINVILITQSSSEHSICVAIEDRVSDRAKASVDREFENEIAVGKIDPLRLETGLSILALVGDNMRFHTGVSGRMFSTLGQNGVNIRAIAQGSSERNISAIIDSADVRKAVNTLHEEFFSDGRKQINIFVAGVGTVGSRLLEQIKGQEDHIANELRLNLRVVGVASSRRELFDDEGLDLTNIKTRLEDAGPSQIEAFTQAIVDKNLRNSIFVDVTASAEVVEAYPKLLKRSVSVIACNKVAASSEFERYKMLKDLAREYNADFLFETNVGAGLPVIKTLEDLIRSGDRVNRIEAVLSGTLNFVFNNYDGTRPFADVVRRAQDEGYTEPDPRLDLSGTDVARKILILAREAGHKLEMSDISVGQFLPEACMSGPVEDFYAEMRRQEGHFVQLLGEATARGQKLKYIASLDGDKAAAELRSIGPEHDFANLSGKDNAVLFFTDRYAVQPLVIKGAGAGADVTAAGVFADIIRASR